MPAVDAGGVVSMALFGFVFGLGFAVAQSLIGVIAGLGREKK